MAHIAAVTAAGFLAQFIIEGIMMSFTVYYPQLMDYYRCDYTSISTIGSAACGLWFLLGPMSDILTRRFGVKNVMVVCGCLSTLAYVAASYATKIWMFICCFAIVGASFGIAYLPAMTAVSYQFESERWRHVVTTFIQVGGATGASFFPLIFERMLRSQPWQSGFLSTAGIVLHIVPCALLLAHPTAPPAVKTELLLDDRLPDGDGTLPAATTTTPKPRSRLLLLAGFGSYSPAQLRNVRFFLTSNVFWNIGSFMFYMGLSLFFDKKGMRETEIARTFAIAGAMLAAGRLFVSLLSLARCGWLERPTIYAATTLISIVPMLMLCFSKGSLLYTVNASIYNFIYGLQTGIEPSVGIDFFGVENLNHGYGLILLASGVSGIIGPLLTGWILDRTDSFFLNFILAASAVLVGSLILVPTLTFYKNLKLTATNNNRCCSAVHS